MLSEKRERELLDEIGQWEARYVELAQNLEMLKRAYKSQAVEIETAENALSILNAKVAELVKQLNCAIEMLDEVDKAHLFHKFANPSKQDT